MDPKKSGFKVSSTVRGTWAVWATAPPSGCSLVHSWCWQLLNERVDEWRPGFSYPTYNQESTGHHNTEQGLNPAVKSHKRMCTCMHTHAQHFVKINTVSSLYQLILLLVDSLEESKETAGMTYGKLKSNCRQRFPTLKTNQTKHCATHVRWRWENSRL